MFNFTGYKSQSKCSELLLTKMRKYIILSFLITDDELSLDHEQHFICISYTESLNLHQKLDARAALIS